MDRKQLPIGKHDFAEFITGNYYFVDKSLCIKELLGSGAAVTLLPRPRRFGKTVNMSMLRYFFEKSDHSNRHLFNGLKIEQYPDCMAKQGQYPVIFLTFKDIKPNNWELCYGKICEIIGVECKRHLTFLKPYLDEQDYQKMFEVTDGTASQIVIESILGTLSAHLHRAYGKRPLILIDEYDAPIHAAAEYNYYDNMVNFMRGFLSSGLKDNSNLEFGVLTGILRIAKESIFSGLNNLEVNTLLQEPYADKFGLLEHEVAAMLEYFGRSEQLDTVRTWYDGYQSGNYKIYNPWSIINFAKTGIFETYWINTSDNALLKKILQQGPALIKESLEQLIRGEPITKEIDENVVMTDILTNERIAWSLLLMSGYLTFANYRRENRKRIVDLKIPNEEIAEIYDTKILSWFENEPIAAQYTTMLRSLIKGDVEDFIGIFSDFAVETLSVFDATGKNPEKFYHGFVLGMLASLRATHEVVSNRESGYGRYDVSIFPHDTTKPGIIIEFKVVNKRKNETLETCSQDAIKQIHARQYETAMRARGITNVIKLGIAFDNKENLVLVG